MSEMTRFRLARDLQRRIPSPDAILTVVRDTGPNPGPTEFVRSLLLAGTIGGDDDGDHDGDHVSVPAETYWMRLVEAAVELRIGSDPGNGNWFVNPDMWGTPTGSAEGDPPPFTRFVDELRKLDVWLAAKGNRPTPDEFVEVLGSVADRLELEVETDNGAPNAIAIVADER